MRIVSVLIVMLAVAGCDETGAPTAVDGGGERPQVSAEKVEAERVCAELTGHTPGAATDDAAKTEAMRQKEFRACVAAVVGEAPAAPELRGRSDS